MPFDTRQLLAVGYLLFCGCASALASDDTVDHCDRLTAGPEDPHRRADPVELAEIDVAAALEACGSARTEHPNEPRLHYQYGRALMAAGQETEAHRSWRRASVYDYEAALYELGRPLLEWSPSQPSMAMRASEGYELLLRAAKRGHAGAAESLGAAHERGWGTYRDLQAASYWYNQAVAAGSISAMHRLGRLLLKESWLKADPKMVLQLFENAAAAGYIDSMVALGRMYERGTGVEADPRLALEWYRKAAERDDAEAMVRLGRLYERGVGTGRNLTTAESWFRRAAEKGVWAGQVALARLLLGKSGWAAEREALTWLTVAALLGDEVAEAEARALAQRLRPIHRRAAEAAARAWVDEFNTARK